MTPSHAGQDDPHQLHPNHLPTPFTASEIRAACPPGRTLRFRVQRDGGQAIVRVSRYVAGDAAGAVQESWAESLDGQRLSDPEQEPSTWLELQEHASFPRATTALAEEVIEIPAGRYACLRYTRTDANGRWTFWFARDLPGQPVRFEHWVADVLTLSSTLIENRSPKP